MFRVPGRLVVVWIVMMIGLQTTASGCCTDGQIYGDLLKQFLYSI